MKQGSAEIAAAPEGPPRLRHLPRQFGKRSRWRFGRARRGEYLARVPVEPTPWQLSTIETLTRLEWAALEAETRLGDLQAARESREHRRLFQRLLADFERSLIVPPAPVPTLAEHFARRAAERAAAAGGEAA